MLRRISAKVLDIEDGDNARERFVARNQITFFLHFVNPIDDQLYLVSLKNLFHFPTFWPIIIVFLAFIVAQNGVLEQVQGGDAFLAVSFTLNLLNILLIFLFTLSQCIDYFHILFSESFKDIAKFFLRRFLDGRVEDLIVLLLALAQGFYQLSLISRDLCVTCGSIFSIQQCDIHLQRNFPINQAVLGYVSLLILSIYFKSIHRHVILMAWMVLTVFVIAAHVYGHYPLRALVVLMMLFFFVSLFEYERYKMTNYLLSKEALSLEKNKLMVMQEKAKIIERKLHMALVHQILPPKVRSRMWGGNDCMILVGC